MAAKKQKVAILLTITSRSSAKKELSPQKVYSIQHFSQSVTCKQNFFGTLSRNVLKFTMLSISNSTSSEEAMLGAATTATA